MSKKILVGDDVMVLVGRDKGKVGKVIKIIKTFSKITGHVVRVVVSGVNICKKCIKSDSDTGNGIKEIEVPIDISNIAFFDSLTNSAVKLGCIFVDGEKKRCIKSSGKVI